jgi:protein PhnA
MAQDDEDYVYDEESGEWLPASELAAKQRGGQHTVEVRDAVGNILLADGDQVTLIKDPDRQGRRARRSSRAR